MIYTSILVKSNFSLLFENLAKPAYFRKQKEKTTAIRSGGRMLLD